MESPQRRIFRFAPSPNGYLHLGHAYSAVLNARATEATGGRLLLRIEDIDRERARPDFEEAIYEDLAWLGLRWEEPVLRQSERFVAYRQALAELEMLGVIYPAFMSRAEIQAAVAEAGNHAWPCDPDGSPLYPGSERDWTRTRRDAAIADGRPFTLRLDMRRALEGVLPLSWIEADPFRNKRDEVLPADPAAWGDVILARRDAPASYHLAVVVDDAHQQVTDVVRGGDLAPATSIHRLLQTLLGFEPPRYFHHRLILDEHGEKLSKSRGSESIRARRAKGETPDDILSEIGLAASPVLP